VSFSSQLIGIQDGYLSLLTESGEVREDLKLPEGDLGKEIEGKFNANEDVQVSREGKQEHLRLIPHDYAMKESYSDIDHSYLSVKSELEAWELVLWDAERLLHWSTQRGSEAQLSWQWGGMGLSLKCLGKP